jgi:hypothetical protein
MAPRGCLVVRAGDRAFPPELDHSRSSAEAWLAHWRSAGDASGCGHLSRLPTGRTGGGGIMATEVAEQLRIG